MQENTTPENLAHALSLFAAHFSSEPTSVTEVKAHASDRKLYRLEGCKNSAIAAINPNLEEDKAFVYLTEHFLKKKLPVPSLYSWDLSRGIVLMEDLGSSTLYELILAEQGINSLVFDYYKRSLDALCRLQIEGASGLDNSRCFPRASFDITSMKYDISQFQTEFLDRVLSGEVYDNTTLYRELTEFLLGAPASYFMHRDFQSRNIMIRDDGRITFIDYQGGRSGPLQYDLVSLVYQTRVDMTNVMRRDLIGHYRDSLTCIIGKDKLGNFDLYLEGFLILRLMQVLGTYGRLGIGGGKTLFLESICRALSMLRAALSSTAIPVDLSSLLKTCDEIQPVWMVDNDFSQED